MATPVAPRICAMRQARAGPDESAQDSTLVMNGASDAGLSHPPAPAPQPPAAL
jgi:hypothetical protein